MPALPKISVHYTERRQSLVHALSVATAEPLRKLLTAALINTDLCLAVYDSYASATPNVLVYLKTHREDLADLVKADLAFQEALSTPPTTADVDHKATMRLSPEACKTLLAGAQLDLLLRQYFAQQTAALTEALDQLYRGEEEDVVAGAIQHLLAFLIGLSPYGYVADGLQRIRQLFAARTAKVRGADSYLRSLELYQVATLHWCLAAQFATDVIANLDDPGRVSVDTAETNLIARMEALGKPQPAS